MAKEALSKHARSLIRCLLQVNNIIDLCTQLDINGDGTVTWDAVYEFTVELGKSGSNAWEKIEDMILSYLPAKVSDKRGEADNRTGIKDGEIERMQCLQMMDKIAVLERDSPVIKLYSAETLELTDCLDGHKGAVLRCIHLEGTDYVVSSGADTSLILWGAFTNNKRQVYPDTDKSARTSGTLGEIRRHVTRPHIPDSHPKIFSSTKFSCTRNPKPLIPPWSSKPRMSQTLNRVFRNCRCFPLARYSFRSSGICHAECSTLARREERCTASRCQK